MKIIDNAVGTQTQSLKDLLQSSKEQNRAHEEQAERQKEQGKTLDEIRIKIMNYEL